ncbi:MAG: hypothetical protein IJN80_07820 [Clostridia bacterium]|nr:hypothetical protein [Clostridia bacterium]
MLSISPQEVVKQLEQFSENTFDDFKEIKNSFETAEKEMEGTRLLSLKSAFEQRIFAAVLFSAFLGFQANLKHFNDPVARTFLEVSPEIYLRKKVMSGMPYYAAAHAEICSLGRNFSSKEFTPILEYYIYLETVGQQYAHYKGFLWGNEYLPYLEPGYAEDHILTHNYRQKRSEWFGALV